MVARVLESWGGRSYKLLEAKILPTEWALCHDDSQAFRIGSRKGPPT